MLITINDDDDDDEEEEEEEEDDEFHTRIDRRLTKRRISGFKLKHKLDKQNSLSVQITKSKPEN